MNTSCHAQLKKQKRQKKNDLKITIISYLEVKLKSQVHTKTNNQAKTKSKNEKQIICYKQKLQIQKKKLIRTTRWTIFRAQDPNRVIDLHQVVILVSTTTTTANIDRKRIFIDDLGRQVNDLGRLVGRRNELRRKTFKRSLGRSIELSDHFFSCLPKK